MDRIPTRSDLTTVEHSSLCLVANGFMSRAISPAHRTRLVQLGLIREAMGGLIVSLCFYDRHFALSARRPLQRRRN